VDATGTVVAVEAEQTNRLYRIRFEERFGPYLIPVGSVAVDGISLTVARLEGPEFTVAIIPHTLEKTIAGQWKPGRRVNLEFDMVGKYVVRWLALGKQTAEPGRITEEWLREQGF
jgi:riboflavin synthase